MAFFKLLLFLFLVTLQIASFTGNGEASSSSSENNGCNGDQNHLLNELKSTVSALRTVHNTLTLFDLGLASQFENPVKHASEVEEKVYELQKQVFGLKREVETQRKRRLEVEAELADKKVAQLSSKLENIDGWFLSKLGLNPTESQAYLMTLWHQHLSPTLHTTLQMVSMKIEQVQKWSEPHIETLNSQWIPSIKDACVTITIYLEPKVQYITDKSIELLYTSKQALTPHLIQGFDASYYYLEVIRTHTHPYTTRIMTLTKPHLERVQVALEPYTENVRHGFQKLVNSTKIYHQQAQEMLKNNEITKPVATMDLAWVGATALIGFPLIFIIKLLSAVSNPKGKKRHNHKKEPTTGYRRAKRRHPHQ
ncbi:unnamed protein product [Arabidopsis thaliana]|uniref:Uncharacterized protein n=1 Tax=Arabidopsis thaliana TaxID=3702 RepID=A0A654FU46_ARATH|nr:unnamed protein product [Arabidopsis thaliana]